ncbi:uncharacterized protein EV420DRAFT_1095899 [Desarmillaria tabescens]|uniref:Uncharacterized protein n=1 Tax=Armillaria tabescens TaxID=1929756 RepID=A0AA39NDJ8_ARMTA|nr:uncharacterized protein EV420DRAFT_1095899 [Desarmillaria tabescens]KAK0463549.1 hypothetical protein EV420DRAFT_1095899 [Desarmillaria tabescens]
MSHLSEAISVTQCVESYIPNLPSCTLPYLPQILRFLLKRAYSLQDCKRYVVMLVADMDKYLQECLHLSRPGITIGMRRNHLRAFLNLTTKELHEPLTAERPNCLDLHLCPKTVAFIERLRNLAYVLNVSADDSAQWQDILQSCRVDDTPPAPVCLEEIASVPLPPKEPSALAGEIPNLSSLWDQLVRLQELLDTISAVENIATELDSQTGPRRESNHIDRTRPRTPYRRSTMKGRISKVAPQTAPKRFLM